MHKIEIIIGYRNYDKYIVKRTDYIDITRCNSWEQVNEKLPKDFELDSMELELLWIKGIPYQCTRIAIENLVTPRDFFETIYHSGVTIDDASYKTMIAYLCVFSFQGFMERVAKYGSSWYNGIHLYENFDWDTYGREKFKGKHGCPKIEETDDKFFNFAEYGKSIKHAYAYRCDNPCKMRVKGILEVRN
jgi:hypothetical protein